VAAGAELKGNELANFRHGAGGLSPRHSDGAVGFNTDRKGINSLAGFLPQRYLCHEAQGVPLVGDGAVGGSNGDHRRGRRGHLADCF
jgi:hypothetical protein